MKLDDIHKKPFFEVPDGYFEHLPGKVQTRIASNQKAESRFVVKYRLQYVIPAALVLVLGIAWLMSPESDTDVESMLATVNTEQLVAYLNDSDLSTEDLMEQVDFTSTDIEDIETEVYQLQLEGESFDTFLDNLDIENM